MRKGTDRSVLGQVWAFREPRRVRQEQLTRWLKSPKVKVRLRALLAMRRQFRRGQPQAYLCMAEPLLWDRSGTVRWQAAIVIGLFIETNPDEVLRVLCEHDHRHNEDACGMFGCVLLEDLLWEHFEEVWPRVTERVRKEQSAMRRWIDMVGTTPLTARQRGKVERLTQSLNRDRKA